MTKNNYPIQIKVDKRLVKLCIQKSKDLPGCPRKNVGSFSWFAKYAIKQQLKRMLKSDAYINELLPMESNYFV